MNNFSTWMIAIFMVMFWLFRAVVGLCTQYSIDMLGIVSYNFTYEVIIAFLTIPCIVLVVKRKIIALLLNKESIQQSFLRVYMTIFHQ